MNYESLKKLLPQLKKAEPRPDHYSLKYEQMTRKITEGGTVSLEEFYFPADEPAKNLCVKLWMPEDAPEVMAARMREVRMPTYNTASFEVQHFPTQAVKFYLRDELYHCLIDHSVVLGSGCIIPMLDFVPNVSKLEGDTYGLCDVTHSKMRYRVHLHQAVMFMHDAPSPWEKDQEGRYVVEPKCARASLDLSHLCHVKLCINRDHLLYEPTDVNGARNGCHHKCKGHFHPITGERMPDCIIHNSTKAYRQGDYSGLVPHEQALRKRIRRGRSRLGHRQMAAEVAKYVRGLKERMMSRAEEAARRWLNAVANTDKEFWTSDRGKTVCHIRESPYVVHGQASQIVRNSILDNDPVVSTPYLL